MSTTYHDDPRWARICPRDRQILRRYAAGQWPREIAKDLGLSWWIVRRVVYGHARSHNGTQRADYAEYLSWLLAAQDQAVVNAGALAVLAKLGLVSSSSDSGPFTPKPQAKHVAHTRKDSADSVTTTASPTAPASA